MLKFNMLFARALVVLLTIGGPLTTRAQVLIREIVSREVSLGVGMVQVPDIREISSREISQFIGGEPPVPYRQAVSREVSTAIVLPSPPPPVTGFFAIPSAAGDLITVDWNNYNQWAAKDIRRFDIYVSETPFNNVTGLTPYTSLPGESASAILTGLSASRDHYVAIVAVDAFGNSNFAVTYSAAYFLAREVISREVSLSILNGPANPAPDAVSREISFVIADPAAPPPVTGFAVTPSPSGVSVALDWNNYNQWAYRDIARFDIYVSESAFTNVAGLSPFISVPGGTASIILTNLPAQHDHYIAIVPVDVLGNYLPTVTYSAAYIISPQVVSREVSLSISGESTPPYQNLASRETSVLITDTNVPSPVTGLNSGFEATTSSNAYRAVDLDWKSYNEILQRDVSRYRVYVDTTFFTNVSSMVPYAYVTNGLQKGTIGGLFAGNVYYVAVVAEDAQGNFDPSVRAVSVITSDRSIWRRAYFTVEELANSSLQSTLWGDGADPDGDGFPNLVEYALGGDLRQASTLNKASSAKLLPYGSAAQVGSDSFFELRFRRQKNSSLLGLRYDVGVTRDLSTWLAANTPGQSWTQGAEIVGPAEPGMGEFEGVRFRFTTPARLMPQIFFGRLNISISDSSDTPESLAITASNPIGYWRFDESSGAINAANSAGSQTGAPFGGVTFGDAPTAQRGFSAHFDGQPGSYISFGQFHPGDNLTLETWVRLDTNAPSENAILARWNGSYLLELKTNKAHFLVRNDSGTQGEVVSPVISSLSTWHQIVGVFNAGVLTLWVDGVPGNSITLGGKLQNVGPIPDRVLAGAYNDGTNNAANLKGYLDEIAIYNRALSQEEITAHYNAGK